MTTTTNKDKPGKTPSAPDKKDRSMLSVEERKKSRDAAMALAKERGYKERRLEGAIIWIPEGTDIM